MSYALTRFALGKQPVVPITSEDFERLRVASARSAIFLGLEEKFDLLVSNYEELELEVLRLPLKELIHPGQDWSSMTSDRMLLARRLVNVLSASRLYVDQIKGDLSTIYGALDLAPVDPRALLSTEYDARIGYRVMEALRNHFQHRSLPIESIYYNAHRNEHNDPSLLRFAVGVRLDLNALRGDDSFKADVLAELDSADKNDIELISYTRSYIEGLGCAHQKLRAGLAGDIAEAEAVLGAAIERWTNVNDNPALLVAMHKDDSDGGEVVEKIFLGGNFTTRRQELVKRNQMLDTLSRRYVTGKRVPRATPKSGH